MLSRKLKAEIEKNPLWCPHIKAVERFKQYLENTKDATFRISGVVTEDGDKTTVTRELPYIHRWTAEYKNMVLAKFYQLEEHFKNHPCPVVTMLTLTTYHAYDQYGRPSALSDATIPQSFEMLKGQGEKLGGWQKISMILRKKGYDYVWILEPHKTGYPHLHVVIFGAVRPTVQKLIKQKWFEYGCGSVKYGAHFSEKKGEGGIKSIKNYLMKYLIKGWVDSNWTTAQLVFNALVKQHGWRLWGASKKITVIMMENAPEKYDCDWQLTEIKSSRYGDHDVVWKKPDTDLKPNIPDPKEPLYTI